MSVNPVRLGRKLTTLRELAGESLSAVAERAQVAKSYLLKLERGEVPNPGLRTLDSVARALNVTLADLMAIENPKSVRGARSIMIDEERQHLPQGLLAFIEDWEKQHSRRMPADVVHSLATLQFRGKRPQTPQDWRYIYDSISRTIGA